MYYVCKNEKKQHEAQLEVSAVLHSHSVFSPIHPTYIIPAPLQTLQADRPKIMTWESRNQPRAKKTHPH